MKRIVVVGAGYAGVLTAKKLHKKLKKESVSITIVNRDPFHVMLTELHEVAAGRVEEDNLRMSLAQIFAGRDVDVQVDTIRSVDFEGAVARGDHAEYPYDYLVLATGCRPAFFGVPGAQEHAFTLWSYDDAIRLRDHIQARFLEASRQVDAAERRRLLTFHVVGGGFTGVEMIGELAEYVPTLCARYGIAREEVTLYCVDMIARITPDLPEKTVRRLERRLTRMGVSLRMGMSVSGVGGGSISIDGKDEPTGTVIWAAGVQGSELCEVAEDQLAVGGRFRLETDAYLRAKGHENVYVAGDNVCLTLPGEEHPVPQMVENAEQSADTVAKNIACAITGQGEIEAYAPKFHGTMVSVGGRYGQAHVGGANRKFCLPSFLAMFAKHFINIIYFLQVLGWNKVFSYLRHEFFTIRRDRSFVGGHLSNKTPSFLLVPLRIWLGLVWIWEGVAKVRQGWFENPMLEGFFGGANAFYQGLLGRPLPGVPDAVAAATPYAASAADAVASATGTADAVAAATDALTSATSAADGAASAGASLFQLDFFGLLQIFFVSGKDLAASALSDFALRINIPLVNSLLDSMVLPSEGLTMFLQIAICIAEILIGLALIAGLFTTVASGGSLVLQLMFVASTGLYLSSIWMVVAAVAVLIGGGRVFGLDYYAMPWLKERWKRVRWVRKAYLYHD